MVSDRLQWRLQPTLVSGHCFSYSVPNRSLLLLPPTLPSSHPDRPHLFHFFLQSPDQNFVVL